MLCNVTLKPQKNVNHITGEWASWMVTFQQDLSVSWPGKCCQASSKHNCVLFSSTKWSKESTGLWGDDQQPLCSLGSCWWASSAIQDHLFSYRWWPNWWICKYSNTKVPGSASFHHVMTWGSLLLEGLIKRPSHFICLTAYLHWKVYCNMLHINL